MPIRRLPEDGAKPPLARGTACHRCFARKVRCSGQPDPETGLHACAACLRTARFKGHELAHCRCAFGSEGLCSEEGGPNLLGEIYPNAGPAPRRKLTSRSSTSSSRTSLVSASSSSLTDVSLASSSATSLHSFDSPLVSPISPTSSLLSVALDKAMPSVEPGCAVYHHQSAPTLYGPLGTGFALPPPVPMASYAHLPALSAAPLYTPHLGTSTQQQQPLSWPDLVQQQQQHHHLFVHQQQQLQQQQHHHQQQQQPFPLPQHPPGPVAACDSHGLGTRSVAPLVVPGLALQATARVTPVSPVQEARSPPPQRPPLMGADVSSKSLLARRAKVAPMSIALPPPPGGKPISPTESLASSRATSPMHVARSASLEQPGSSFAQQSLGATFSMQAGAPRPPVSMALSETAMLHDHQTPSGYPSSVVSRDSPVPMPVSNAASTHLAVPPYPAHTSGVPSPGLLLPGFGSSLHLPESRPTSAHYGQQQLCAAQSGHNETYPAMSSSSLRGPSYSGGLVAPAPSSLEDRSDGGQPLDLPMPQGPATNGEMPFDMSEWTGSFHLYSPGLTFSSSTPHWFAAQSQQSHYFAR